MQQLHCPNNNKYQQNAIKTTKYVKKKNTEIYKLTIYKIYTNKVGKYR